MYTQKQFCKINNRIPQVLDQFIERWTPDQKVLVRDSFGKKALSPPL